MISIVEHSIIILLISVIVNMICMCVVCVSIVGVVMCCILAVYFVGRPPRSAAPGASTSAAWRISNCIS